MVLQDLNTLSKGFAKLGAKYTQSVARISHLEDRLQASLSDSEQMKVQIATLQDELRVQAEVMGNLTSTLRVRINVFDNHSQ